MATTFNDTYEIRSVIGKGGMSTVYLAEHKRLHTRWAVKEVRKEQGARFDFLAESNILKRLQHPMLPRIVDIFEDAQHIFIVEDYVEGETLETVLKRQGKVDEATGLQWFRDLCGVLDYLHNQKPNPIIYRDMKPSNVMLQPDGSLKLIDFGIAREYKQDSNADTTYIGTKGYAAPEQFGTAQTDARTDIYALGVTMYHLLTGKSPYEPPYQFVPARQLEPRLSHGVEYILDHCVQPEPADRYQSVQELLDDLEHIYKFDKAYQHYQAVKRTRVIILAVMFLASVGLMVGGRVVMGQEKEARYESYLSEASQLYTSDLQGAQRALALARTLYPDRVDADRQETYALFLNGAWQDCVDYGEKTLEKYGADVQTRLTMASAQFELRDYEAAAEGFAQGGELSADNLRDYAVCLGRMGRTEEAEAVLQNLVAQGADPIVTEYVQGEVYLAQEEYLRPRAPSSPPWTRRRAPPCAGAATSPWETSTGTAPPWSGSAPRPSSILPPSLPSFSPGRWWRRACAMTAPSGRPWPWPTSRPTTRTGASAPATCRNPRTASSGSSSWASARPTSTRTSTPSTMSRRTIPPPRRPFRPTRPPSRRITCPTPSGA